MQSKRKHSEVKVSLTKSSRWIIRPMPFFGGGPKEMTGHSGREKVPLKGGIDEILQRAICQVQPNLRSHSSDSQNSFIVWLAIKCFCIPGNAVAKILTIHLKFAKKRNRISFCPQKSLPCRGSLLGVCWRSLPGGGFLVSRSWTFSGPNVIYLYPDCRLIVCFFKDGFVSNASLSKGQLWLELFKIVMWNKPGSLRSKTAQGRFRTWWVFSSAKGKI